ncbi:FAD-containing monooxygenase EthA [Variibacter gotjawalensis]|uniref:FAD-containing monooxygenase EthA n=1 Tax=Variibacter gotjawalensis TaxID=1333996 RepID=A0A0S3PQN8_9BRAD|nr:NAD(P)/FAD-dependent oxidoreductase [Variibacter gotjawalensis]NIK48505.1 cation diffusion facilitator CzcD-associated flavoprotein CzcO [Variibacter gotjawalensis]RZS50370.1 cation diffusion facilitator CzcD-associated flavoprotein CzcO [Variibacter gotjawalensis]BAT58205.1 FAD-containing monooxygenase EthA [Variibacter gotjawalensis]
MNQAVVVDQASAQPVSPARSGSTHFDVIVVGAGLSGIGAAYNLQSKCPQRTFAILEGRDAIGGTWDLFRYPGIRSDSDMHTLGFNFRPWNGEKAIADGPSIRDYVRETAEVYGIDKKIRFGHRVVKADWSSADAAWTLTVETADGAKTFSCNFLYCCSGYYDYAGGYMPGWPGMDTFAGTIAHPQKWPEELDYTGKRVVVIGSGATAVTLVPAMSEKAAHVTMLQRSPTYIIARPAEDAIANFLNRVLPRRIAGSLTKWKNVARQQYYYRMMRKKPAFAKGALIHLAKQQLPEGYDVAKHLTPRYNPWDERLCLVPDGDLFRVIRDGKAAIETDTIETFMPTGLKLASGKEIPADIIVTATGLNVQLLGGMQLTVDGKPVELGKTVSFKGAMFSGIPNLALAFGYANASWTLKADLSSAYLCRLLNHMDARGYAAVMPREMPIVDDAAAMLPLQSGYIKRSMHLMPKQGAEAPWKANHNYMLDVFEFRFGKVDDAALVFTPRAAR